MRFFILLISIIILFFLTLNLCAQQLIKLNNLDTREFDGNQIKAFINNDGELFYDRGNKSAAFIYPRNSLKTAINSTGLWIGGKDRNGRIRLSVVQSNQTEYQPGNIQGVYDTKIDNVSVAANPMSEQFRIYKIIKSDSSAAKDGSYDAWSAWPVTQGAPWIDVDGDGKYNLKKGDKPKFYGDQQLFWVFNDVNYSGHINNSQTLPIGIEVRVLLWGYNQQGALGNTIFCKWQIINKSDTTLSSAYLAIYSDVDLGFAKDDFPACDTVLKMGYVYNGSPEDVGLNGYGNLPPAVGIDLLQGAIVRTESEKDSALINDIWRKGRKNLTLTSFAYFGTQTGVDPEPPLSKSNYAKVAYGYLSGIRGWFDTAYINPLTRLPSKFPLSGDPISDKGWLPRNNRPVLNPQNIKILLSSGPFEFAANDTQEVICAFLIAQGTDRINSIKLLRAYDEIVEEAYRMNFKIPGPPPQPNVKFSELSNEVILDWSNNDSTEQYEQFGYKFQGYNVYQGQSEYGPWKKISTYDVKDGIREIYDWQIDPETGLKFWAPIIIGTDSGLKRNLKITSDYFTDTKLVNGKEYFFAVTSYAYNKDSSSIGIKPAMLENYKQAIKVIPHSTPVGSLIPTEYKSILPHNRTGDDAVQPIVLLPTLLDGKTYQVTFNGDGMNVTSWNLIQKESGDTIIRSCTNFSGDDNSPIHNGFQVKVVKPRSGVRKDTQIPPGWSYYNAVAGKVTTSTATNLTWFKGQGNTTIQMDAIDAAGLTYPTETNFMLRPSKVPPDSLLKVEIRFSNKNTQRAYRYIANVPIFPPNYLADSSFEPYIKYRGGGWIYQDYNKYPAPKPDTTFENPDLGPVVPFTVWEVDSTDGDYIPRQLNVAIVEKNDSLWSKQRLGGEIFYRGRGRVDGKWDPTVATLGGSELLFIFKSTYSDTAQEFYKNLNLSFYENADVMYVLWLRKAGLDTVRWNEGDVLTIYPNYPLSTRRVYEFVAKKQIFDDKLLMQSQLNRIKVFPNPYFGYNKAEKSNTERFISFSNLPSDFKIRIFSLAGDLIRTISNEGYNLNNPFVKWDLKNDLGIYVASGIYIANIEIPDVGNKILKIVIIQPDQGYNPF